MKRLVAFTAGALVAIPAIAWACGGGGGDSGSSGGDSGGDSGSSYSSSDSGTAAPSCHDTSDVHGYRECTGFGAWRARKVAVAVELAAVSSLVDLSGVTASGDIAHSDGSTYTYRVVGEDLASELRAAHGLALRTVLHGRHLYGGLESSYQFVDAEERRIYMESGAMLAPSVAGVTSVLGVVGARRFADQLLGPLAPHGVSAGAELGAGVRMTAIVAESQKGACITIDRTVDVAPAALARARVDLWLTPHLSMGLWGGTDLLTRAPSAGLVLSSHFRAYDGTR
ncbi:MAG: hypothetical protein K8M05_30275 [Deltaproteobacteria bacterium]|nr:hypothetical protein [Kofleriaceae bacterium]